MELQDLTPEDARRADMTDTTGAKLAQRVQKLQSGGAVADIDSSPSASDNKDKINELLAVLRDAGIIGS